MIDLHSHILPELDDGAHSLRESLAMARMAVDSGITSMVATPHCADDQTRDVYAAWQFLQEALQETGIPLTLFPGMEIFGTEDTAKLLREGKLLTLNGSHYPLIEFSFHSSGEEESWILSSVCNSGFRPIVAHPERYSYVQRDPRILNSWLRMGCLLQVNRGSLLGRFGRQAQAMAVELVERGFATVVATDAHSAQVRTPWMRDIREVLTREVSPQCARMLLQENPKRILQNEELRFMEPEWF
jgi:protein-tyrosine phosphatase